jgi:hypothetical protein
VSDPHSLGIDEADIASAVAAQTKRDLNTATVRTSVPMFWTFLLIYAIKRITGFDLSMDKALMLSPAFAVVGGVLYRIFRVVEAKYPRLGFIFLGSNKTPNFYA